jgi:hypothetical protein
MTLQTLIDFFADATLADWGARLGAAWVWLVAALPLMKPVQRRLDAASARLTDYAEQSAGEADDHIAYGVARVAAAFAWVVAFVSALVQVVKGDGSTARGPTIPPSPKSRPPAE